MGNANASGELAFNTRCRVFGQTYAQVIRLNVDPLRLPAVSWAYVALRSLAKVSETVAQEKGDVRAFHHLVEMACFAPSTREYLIRPLPELGRYEVVACFKAMEDLLDSNGEKEWSESYKARTSGLFRKWLTRPIQDTIREPIGLGRMLFRTRFDHQGSHRQTLSDRVGKLDDGVLANPLGAMPHENLSKLRERETERMTRDITRLRDGCLDELRFWGNVRKQMLKIALYAPSVEELSLTKLFLLGASTWKELRALEECTDEAIVASMVRLANDVDFPRHPTHKQHRKSNISERIIEYLGIPEYRLDSVRTRNIFYLTRSALTKELVVAFYPLLIHTRFNAGSLREVIRSWVTAESGIYTLKGYKSKSDQETPLIDITRESQAAYEAIELLLWNFDQLKRFRHIGEHEGRLWFAWDQTSKEQLSAPISNFQNVKKLLLHRLGMDWFSDDQVRTHMLVLDRIKGGASVQSLRDRAGHKTESTTSIYFMNIASMRHSSSINLEFQRRIDSTIKFELSNERRFFADKFDPRYVDKNLLFPIGDGTSCTSPFEPPDPTWLVNDMCDAKNCHAGIGCPRNQIVLGKQRVMEVWTTSFYYAASWKRLLAENEDAFQKWHGPSMIFNLALKKYIRDSSYWPLVEPIVRSYEKKGTT